MTNVDRKISYGPEKVARLLRRTKKQTESVLDNQLDV